MPEKKPKDGESESAAPVAEGPQPLSWQAPQIARIALNDFPAVYKLYAIIDQTKLPGNRATAECSDFIAELLPALEAAMRADTAPAPTAGGAEPPAEPPAESAPATTG